MRCKKRNVLRFLSSWYAASYVSLSSPAAQLPAQPHSPRQQNLLVNRNRLSRWNHPDRRPIGTVPFSLVQSRQTERRAWSQNWTQYGLFSEMQGGRQQAGAAAPAGNTGTNQFHPIKHISEIEVQANEKSRKIAFCCGFPGFLFL